MWQKTREQFAEVKVVPDERLFRKQLAHHMAFWQGLAAPQRVTYEDRQRCSRCWQRRFANLAQFHIRQRTCASLQVSLQ